MKGCLTPQMTPSSYINIYLILDQKEKRSAQRKLATGVEGTRSEAAKTHVIYLSGNHGVTRSSDVTCSKNETIDTRIHTHAHNISNIKMNIEPTSFISVVSNCKYLWLRVRVGVEASILFFPNPNFYFLST